MKNFFLGLVSIVVALTVLALGGEVATRAYYLFRAHVTNQKLFTIIALDDKYGWLPATNYAFSGVLRDGGGNPYPVDMTTDDRGFRLYGNPQETRRKKVLFVGDSFTQAMHVSDDKTYYALLRDELDIEVFAYGVEGYGTLQEYMILDRFIDEIKPDAVVIQFCPNDIINNLPALERNSTLNRMGLRRPYFIDGQIVYVTAAPFPRLRDFAAKYSRLLYIIIKRIDRLNVRPEESIERVIRVEGMQNPLFRQSVEIAGQVLKMIRARVPPQTEIYAFSSDWGRPYHPEFKRISAEAGIHFIDGDGRALRMAEDKGIVTRARDNAHWNNEGHRIVANVLRRYFRKAWAAEPDSSPP